MYVILYFYPPQKKIVEVIIQVPIYTLELPLFSTFQEHSLVWHSCHLVPTEEAKHAVRQPSEQVYLYGWLSKLGSLLGYSKY